jgi:hypothetical protein
MLDSRKPAYPAREIVLLRSPAVAGCDRPLRAQAFFNCKSQFICFSIVFRPDFFRPSSSVLPWLRATADLPSPRTYTTPRYDNAPQKMFISQLRFFKSTSCSQV